MLSTMRDDETQVEAASEDQAVAEDSVDTVDASVEADSADVADETEAA